MEEIEVIQVVVLLEVSKLNKSVKNEKQGNDVWEKWYSIEKTLKKGKWIHPCFVTQE